MTSNDMPSKKHILLAVIAIAGLLIWVNYNISLSLVSPTVTIIDTCTSEPMLKIYAYEHSTITGETKLHKTSGFYSKRVTLYLGEGDDYFTICDRPQFYLDSITMLNTIRSVDPERNLIWKAGNHYPISRLVADPAASCILISANEILSNPSAFTKEITPINCPECDADKPDMACEGKRAMVCGNWGIWEQLTVCGSDQKCVVRGDVASCEEVIYTEYFFPPSCDGILYDTESLVDYYLDEEDCLESQQFNIFTYIMNLIRSFFDWLSGLIP